MGNHNFVNIFAYEKSKSYPGKSEMLGISSPFMFEIIRTGQGTGEGSVLTNEFRVSAPVDWKFDYVAGVFYMKKEKKCSNLSSRIC